MKDRHCLGEISKRRDAQPRYAVKIQHIADAIVAAGYLSLDSQAKALGVKRSTAWTIIKTKHKLDRLSGKTTNRMLANPELPPSARAVIQQYLAERSVGRKPRQRQNLSTHRSLGAGMSLLENSGHAELPLSWADNIF